MKPKEWGLNILLGIDQLANTIIRGDPDETMTTSTAPLPLESLATFAQFAQAAASSSAGVVLFASFDAPPAQPLPGTKSFDDFVSELEADPELAAELAASRQELSAALYPDAQESLAASRPGPQRPNFEERSGVATFVSFLTYWTKTIARSQ